jgi:hypothetical protein
MRLRYRGKPARRNCNQVVSATGGRQEPWVYGLPGAVITLVPRTGATLGK